MWRIEHDQIERIVREWQRREVANDIGIDLYVAAGIVFVVRDNAVVAKFNVRIVLVKPEHFATAARVKNAFVRYYRSLPACGQSLDHN